MLAAPPHALRSCADPRTHRALTALAQVARAVVPSEADVRAGVEAQLIPWLQPEFVFVQTPAMMLVWGEAKAMEDWGEALVAVLPHVRLAQVEAALRDARRWAAVARHRWPTPPPTARTHPSTSPATAGAAWAAGTR